MLLHGCQPDDLLQDRKFEHYQCGREMDGQRLSATDRSGVEWEKAARGGQNGKRFPWGDTITHNQANYYSSASYAYDISPTRNYHPTWGTGSQPYTSPLSSFAPNAYGLFDMAGNVFDWCWDWYDGNWYGQPGSTSDDSRGPSSVLTDRVRRGGAWNVVANYARSAARSDDVTPGNAYSYLGFRCARGL